MFYSGYLELSLNSLALFYDSTVGSSGHAHMDTGDPITGEDGGSVRNILRVAPLFLCCVLLFLSLHQQGWKWVRTYPKGVVGVEMRGREPCFWTRSQEGFEPISKRLLAGWDYGHFWSAGAS